MIIDNNNKKEELKENKEVVVMNDNKIVEVAGATQESKKEEIKENKEVNVMNNTKAVAGATNNVTMQKEQESRERLEKMRRYGTDCVFVIERYINGNDKVEMSPKERNCWERVIKPRAKALCHSIHELTTIIPWEEQKTAELEQHLKENPVTGIRIEKADKGKFSIIKVATGKVLETEEVEKLKGIITGLHLAQQETEE